MSGALTLWAIATAASNGGVPPVPGISVSVTLSKSTAVAVIGASIPRAIATGPVGGRLPVT